MNKFVTLAASAAMVLSSAGVTLAGGPVGTATEVEPVADDSDFTPTPLLFGSLGAGGAVVAVVAVAAVAAAAGGGGSSTTTTNAE